METITNKNTLKSWFRRGLKPLETQFAAWMDSYWHKSEQIPTSTIEGLEATLNSKAESSGLDALVADLADHAADDTRHKTPGEQSQLDHLAADPNDTYATKTEISGITPFTISVTIDADGKYIVPEEDKTALYAYLLADGKPELVQVKMKDKINKVQENTYQCTYSNITDNHSEKRLISGSIKFLCSIVQPKAIVGKTIAISVNYREINTSIIKSVVVHYTECAVDFYSSAVIQLLDPNKTINLDTINQTGGFAGLCLDDTYIAIGLPEGFVSVPGVPLSFSGMTLIPTAGGKSQILFNRANGDMYTRVTDNSDAWMPWKKQAQAEKCETIVFTGTYETLVSTGTKLHTLDEGQTDKFISYIEQSKTNPVILQFSNTEEPNILKQDIYTLNKIYQNGGQHDLEFVSVENGKITKMRLRMMKSSSGFWGSNISLSTDTYPFNAEYQYDRYYNPASTFDMNNFTESGGFVAEASENSIGVNIPAGFTEFYGYILKNNGGVKSCCTQVLTDRILLKTMMRSSVPDAAYRNRVWTPWKEIGGDAMKDTVVLNATMNNATDEVTVTNLEAVAVYAAARDGGRNPQIVLNVSEVMYYPQVVTYTGTGFAMICPSVTIASNGIVSIYDISLMFLKSGDTWTLMQSTRKNAIINPPDYLKVSNIHVVAEYPTDLAAYPEGAIFIKQPQA